MALILNTPCNDVAPLKTITHCAIKTTGTFNSYTAPVNVSLLLSSALVDGQTYSGRTKYSARTK
jgi:hypothetical protein